MPSLSEIVSYTDRFLRIRDVGEWDNAVNGLQIETSMLQIDEDVIEAGSREGAGNLGGAVHLQAVAIDGLASLEAFTGGIGSHRYGSTISGCR